jgi:uncharacterized membrane protein
VLPLNPHTSTSTDQKITANHLIDARVGQALLLSLLLTLVVMVAGLLVLVVKGKNATTRVIPLDHLYQQLVGGNPSAILDVGIVLLFAAPLIGVLVACLGFVHQRDARFAFVTAGLIIILLASFAVALR